MIASIAYDSEIFDVIIVGAGPAGASTAKVIGDSGLKCLLLEKYRLPRYKMCSGILGPTSMKFVAEHFGPMPDEVKSTPYDVVGFQAHKAIGQKPELLSFDMLDPGDGKRIGCSIKRPEFDNWLSVKSGVPILDECNLVKLILHDNVNTLIVKHGEEQLTLKSKYVVGADGPLSKVRTSINQNLNADIRLIPNYEEWYVGEVDLKENWLHCFYDKKLTSYFATLFHKDGNIIVVTGSKKNESTRKYFHELIKYLKKSHDLKIKATTTNHGCVLHDMSATDNFYLGTGNVLLAGEAGGFNRCAEGISSALITGKAAGDAILQSVKTGLPAIAYYDVNSAGEAEVCRKASALIEKSLGFNPFTR